MNRVLRSSFKQRWNSLTDADLDQVQGRADRVVTLLQDKCGYTRQRAEDELLRFLDESLARAAREPSPRTRGAVSAYQ